MQNIPPAQLHTVTVSSVTTTGSTNEEPTTVVTTGVLSEVVVSSTTGPVENAPPGDEATFGGEECNLLGVNVSSPTTGQGVTGEDDVHHGEVSTHTERSSVSAGEFPP
jgi:hypothetical protein